jgi:hypothetical protein
MTDEHRPSDPKDEGTSDRITRREWLAEIGAAALAASLPPGIPGAEAIPDAALPPGLYMPSSEHLGHALENDGVFRAIPAGSPTDYIQPVPGAFKPAFFSGAEYQTIHRMVAILLGLPLPVLESSRSSGAAPMMRAEEDPVEIVAQWIDLRMASAAGIRQAAKALSPEHRVLAEHFYGAETARRVEVEEADRTCREGLAWLDQVSKKKRGAEFVRLSEPQQIEILQIASTIPQAESADHTGARFFELIKAETIRGYYTSRRGLQELDYKGNSFYPVSPGCSTDAAEGRK